MNSPLQPLDLWLLGHRRGALTLAAALAAFVPLCWIVIQLHGSFPGDNGTPLSRSVVVITTLGPLGWFALARGHRATCAAMLLVILAMGPLRVIDGAHWPSDVLAGYALGLAWTIAVLAIGLPWAAGLRQTGDHP